MLQQTTVAAVVPKYERFVAEFPDETSLARASEDRVLKAWAGLGYYARARNLLRAARQIKERHGGHFPSDPAAVRELAGIGRYTAGAILSIAFEKPYAVVDGNVVRVLSRFYGLRGRAKDQAFVEKIWDRAEKIVSPDAPGDWNQALMELGATVCAPTSPNCGACPLAANCAAKAKSLQEKIPSPEIRKELIAVRWTVLWIERGGKVLLWRRDSNERLLKNLWGLPEASRVPAVAGEKISSASQTITHHAVRVDLRSGILKPNAKPPAQARWVATATISNYLVASLWTKLIPRIETAAG